MNEKSNREIAECAECESEYFADTSTFAALCPDCAHHLYGYENCKHNMVHQRCTNCYWNGKTSLYLKKSRGVKDAQER